jgi:tRNA A37 N6-isopentenylltransferase MiaA
MNKVIILLGPTGVGKTEVSILARLWAQRYQCRLNADLQWYGHRDCKTVRGAEDEREAS